MPSLSCERVDLYSLIAEFYESSDELATFRPAELVPPPFAELLDHNHHMTVTVESFHGEPVDVVVHRSQTTGKLASQTYTREITLVTQTSRRTVQYGIVRLRPDVLEPAVWAEIARCQIPLGRVLIQHNVLREVQLCRLWDVRPGRAMRRMLKVSADEPVHGRTALIYCDSKPAIELLEVVVDRPAAPPATDDPASRPMTPRSDR